ncbi:MAG: MFS transporter [Phototrophicaceae bacterium]|jgi:EmrB/QacA subfamily drug resistance transporter
MEKTKNARVGRWVLVSTVLASTMAFLDGSALNVALPTLQASFGASAADVLWISNSYLLMLAALILVGGALGDHFGRKRVFGIGIWVFTLASVACGFAPNVGVMIVARVIQGIGGALMIPGSLAIISANFDDQSRGEAIGIWSGFSTLSGIGGPILGGLLADVDLLTPIFGAEVAMQLWRGVFFINVPLAAVALWALYTYVPETRNESLRHSPLDYIGTLLVTLGLGGISYGLIQGSAVGFASIHQIAIVVGGLLLVAFVIWEGRTPAPMMPLNLFRSPVFSATNLFTLALYAALQGVFFFFGLNLIQVQGYAPSLAGLVNLPFTVFLILLARTSGRWSDRVGARVPMTLGATLTGACFFLLGVPGLTNGITDYWWAYLPAAILGGVGMGITITPLTSAVMGSVPQSSAGTASGVNNAVSRTAGVLAIVLFGALMLVGFRAALLRAPAVTALTSEQQAALLENASDLGNFQVPALIPADQVAKIQLASKLAFVEVFRWVAWIGAGLAWISAAISGFGLRLRPEESRELVK